MRCATHIQIHGTRALSLYNTAQPAAHGRSYSNMVVCGALVWVHPNWICFHIYLLWSLGLHIVDFFAQVLRHLVWRFWPRGQCNGGERNFICGSRCIKKTSLCETDYLFGGKLFWRKEFTLSTVSFLQYLLHTWKTIWKLQVSRKLSLNGGELFIF